MKYRLGALLFRHNGRNFVENIERKDHQQLFVMYFKDLNQYSCFCVYEDSLEIILMSAFLIDIQC